MPPILSRFRVSNLAAFGLLALLFFFCVSSALAAAGTDASTLRQFPPPLETYNDRHLKDVWDVLQNRVRR
jgi:hypothetical protein